MAAIFFCFTAGTLIPHASPSLQTGGGACEHPTAPFARPGVGTSAWYRGDNRIRGAGRSERGRGGIEVGGGNGDGNGDVDGQGDGAGAGTGVEANEGAQDGNGDGSGDGAGTGTGVGIRRRTPDGNGDGNGDVSEDCSGDGDEDNGNENRIGEGGRGTKKRKKPQNSCRRRAGNGGDMGGKRKKCRKERAGSVAANSDNLGSYKEAGGGAQGAQGSSKICTSRESVSPLFLLFSSH